MSPSAAEDTSLIILRANAMLDSQLVLLQDVLETDEFAHQRQLFGAAMSALLDIVNPIYQSHPQLKPAQMGGSYAIPAWAFQGLMPDKVRGET